MNTEHVLCYFYNVNSTRDFRSFQAVTSRKICFHKVSCSIISIHTIPVCNNARKLKQKSSLVKTSIIYLGAILALTE